MSCRQDYSVKQSKDSIIYGYFNGVEAAGRYFVRRRVRLDLRRKPVLVAARKGKNRRYGSGGRRWPTQPGNDGLDMAMTNTATAMRGLSEAVGREAAKRPSSAA